VVCQWLVGRGLADDVEEVSIDYRHGRGLDYDYILDASVAPNNCSNGEGNEAVGVYVPIEARNVQPIVVGEIKNLLLELALIFERIGSRRPNQGRQDGNSDNSQYSIFHEKRFYGSSVK
jgi:hypothetical protein